MSAHTKRLSRGSPGPGMRLLTRTRDLENNWATQPLLLLIAFREIGEHSVDYTMSESTSPRASPSSLHNHMRMSREHPHHNRILGRPVNSPLLLNPVRISAAAVSSTCSQRRSLFPRPHGQTTATTTGERFGQWCECGGGTRRCGRWCSIVHKLEACEKIVSSSRPIIWSARVGMPWMVSAVAESVALTVS